MSARATRLVFAAQCAVLATICTVLLLRDAAAIFRRVPLDPNEGWNAYHATAGLAGLYPPPTALMVNNYPPLSFPLVAALGRLTGDEIVAGRILSLLAFLTAGWGIMLALRRMGCTASQALFGALVFGAGLLIGSDYVAMDDPQLLGHALQIAGLLLSLRERLAAAALLLVVGIFVKHNLLALPLACGVWLFTRDRRTAARFALASFGFGIAGLLMFRLLFGVNLVSEIGSPRLYTFANFENLAWRFFQWSAAAMEFSIWLALSRRHDIWVRLVVLYSAIALVIGLVFSGGDGVDVNIFFDSVIALALAVGLIQRHFGSYPRMAAGLAIIVPLVLYGAEHFQDDDFPYTRAFRAQAPRDITFLTKGPALCERLSLCYWAGDKSPVDVFNLGEEIAAGTRPDTRLVRLLETRHFRAVQFDSLEAFALGAQVRTALLENYRLDHEDDNGFFFRPR